MRRRQRLLVVGEQALPVALHLVTRQAEPRGARLVHAVRDVPGRQEQRQREEPGEQHQAPDRLSRQRPRTEEQERDDGDTHDERDDCRERKHEMTA